MSGRRNNATDATKETDARHPSSPPHPPGQLPARPATAPAGTGLSGTGRTARTHDPSPTGRPHRAILPEACTSSHPTAAANTSTARNQPSVTSVPSVATAPWVVERRAPSPQERKLMKEAGKVYEPVTYDGAGGRLETVEGTAGEVVTRSHGTSATKNHAIARWIGAAVRRTVRAGVTGAPPRGGCPGPRAETPPPRQCSWRGRRCAPGA
jgi:hypothetical protein